jgi:hypothetical protein
MTLQATPYAPPLAAAGLAFAAAAVWLARSTDRGFRSARVAVPLFAATAVWTLGYAAELTVTGYDLQVLLARVQYVGNVSVPLLWFAYVAAYVGAGDAVPRWGWGALAVPPVVVLALVAAYPASTLVWADVTQVTVGGDALLETHYGPAFFAFMAYVYALVLAATALLAAACGPRGASTAGRRARCSPGPSSRPSPASCTSPSSVPPTRSICRRSRSS